MIRIGLGSLVKAPNTIQIYYSGVCVIDRTIIDPLEQMRDFDFVSFEHDVLLGLGFIAKDILSQLTTSVVGGFAAAQTNPTSLSLTVGAGRIYTPAAADLTAAGSIPQDLQTIIQQGINVGQTLTLVAPAAGQSQWNLVQVQFQQADAVRAGDPNGGTVPFYNSSNPAVPNNVSISTVRQGTAVIQVIQGNTATTGSEVPPQPTSGWTPLYLIDLAGGQTGISTPQIIKAGPSVGTGVPNNFPVAPFIAGLQAAHHNGNPGQAPKISLTKEVSGVLPYANMSPVRTLLFAPLVLYVNGTTGSDTNSGMTSSTAFKTIQAAINTCYRNYDFNGNGCTINVANGSYSAAAGGNLWVATFTGLPSGLPAGKFSLIGNPSSPGSVALAANSSNGIFIQLGAFVTIEGFTITASGANSGISAYEGYGLNVSNGGYCNVSSCVFGACGSYQVQCAQGSTTAFGGSPVTFTGSTIASIISTHGSLISIAGSSVTLSGLTCSNAFAVASDCGEVALGGNTFIGTVTGQGYNASFNGIVSGVGTVSYVPSTVASSPTPGSTGAYGGQAS